MWVGSLPHSFMDSDFFFFFFFVKGNEYTSKVNSSEWKYLLPFSFPNVRSLNGKPGFLWKKSLFLI